MNKTYYIIGASGFAKEILFLTEQVLGTKSTFMGFVDSDKKKDFILINGDKTPVISEEFFFSKIKPNDSISLFMGVGNPSLLKTLSEKFSDYNFPNLIHPNFIGDKRGIKMKKGNIITAGCVFTVDIKIGSFNIFNLNTTIGHDSVIGDCNVFNPGTNVSGNSSIGSWNLFGTNSTVLQMLKIENDNVIGASALITKNVSSNNLMVGVPAKKIV